MIYNLTGTILFLIAAWLIGLAALKASGVTKGDYAHIHFLSMPLGIAVCALTATAMYFTLGLSVSAIRMAYGVLAAGGVFIIVKKGIQRKEVYGLGTIFLFFGIMVLPGLIHGDQYYVHRGNLYDQYFYMSEVVYMSLHKLSYGLSGMMDTDGAMEVIRHGFGAINSDRPTAPLLCAVLAGKSWGNVFFQAYLFIQMVWASAFGAMMLAFEMVAGKCRKSISGKKTVLLLGALSLIYIWGFFGQIQYDIDAWSQMVTIGSLLSMVCIYFIALPGILEGKSLPWGTFLILVIIGAGNFTIYPENTMLLGVLLVAVSIAACLVRKIRIKGKTIAILAAIPILAVGVTALVNFNVIKFSIYQIGTSTSDVRQSWATYFNQYWLGFHTFIAGSPMAAAIKKLAALLPSVFGMFIITPDYEVRILPITIIWLGFTALVSIGILAIVFLTARKSFSYVRSQETRQEGFFALLAAGSLVIFTIMMFCGKYWSAGKLFLYMSPYIFIMMSLPFRRWLYLEKEEKKSAKAGTVVKTAIRYLTVGTSLVFLLCQIFMVGMRIHDTAENKDGTGYLGNYPSDQVPYLKESFRYCFDASAYAGEPVVAINIENMWYLDYVKISLAYEGIPYYAVPDNVFDRGIPNEIQPVILEGHTVITLDDTENRK